MTLKIAILPPDSARQRVLNDKHLTQLKQWGEVVCNGSGTNDPEAIRGTIANADIAITTWGTPSLSGDILDAAPHLKAVIHAAGTVKPIVSPELWSRGIRVSSGNGPLGKGVAETALGLTIASLKNMWKISRETEEGGWAEEKQRVRELYDITVGVIGAGKAGQHYIKLLQNFDVTVLLADPLVTAEQAKAIGASKVELEQLLGLADVVSIHAPSLPSTYKMINRERLALMKDNAILINTARGSIIDEEALIAELRQERLSACIDVTDPEPPVADHPFRSLRNCTLTSHIAGSVTNGMYRLGQFAVNEVELWKNGGRMEGEVEESEMAFLA
ncbi:hydroxyacid dehydrogenase [Paenibacillus hodogayensis]|uniref:Hydroxyacid dehydrogenase n=1 Tax=Paenibacillus hodogayensis TaxID=279208 RepID=A0ABV5W6P1_9BACL